VDECKPLIPDDVSAQATARLAPRGAPLVASAPAVLLPVAPRTASVAPGRGSHSSNFQLNLSRFRVKRALNNP